MSIGERIIDLRKKQNISQGELATKLGITRQAVSKWENDLSSPDTINLIRLADVLDTDVEFLATGRASYGRRPPVVIKETVEVEKIVEKPVVQVVEKVIEKVVERPTVEFVDKIVTKKVYRKAFVRNPVEYIAIGLITFLIGLLIGLKI